MASAGPLPPPFLMKTVDIVHPPHLEGDSTLATEILPGPPPLASIQQSFVKRPDVHKKPLSATSYLPTSDPGSSYGGLALPGLLTSAMPVARTERA
jgi:hypothetical protein